MARPKIAKAQQMVTRAFRAPPEFWAKFDAKVEQSGLSGAEYHRRAILNDETFIQAVAKQTPIEKEVLRLVDKTSNNINQLAHAVNLAHSLGRMPYSLYKDIDDSLDDILRRLIATL